ncbi:MAG: hypothetical protein ACK559_19840 [bacterium]
MTGRFERVATRRQTEHRQLSLQTTNSPRAARSLLRGRSRWPRGVSSS